MAHELGIVAAWLIATICIALLSHRGWAVFKQRRTFKMSRRGWEVVDPPPRFGLADLLIFVTLIAAVIGALVGIANEDKHGIREFRFEEEMERDAAHEQHSE